MADRHADIVMKARTLDPLERCRGLGMTARSLQGAE
jgi:hypothetical protein